MIRSYTNNELIKLMDMAPLPVQRAIESKGTVAIVTGLGTRLGLHIDQIGKIAALNVQMLLGLVSPEEFLKELIAAKVPEKDAREIMTEINQKIFMPLRDEMRKETIVAPVAPEVAKPAVPQPQQPAKPLVSAMLQSAAATPPRQLLAEVKPPQILVPAPPISPRPALRDVLASVMKAPPAPQKAAPPPPPNLPGVMPEKPVVSDKAQGASSPVSLKSSTLPITLSSAPPKPIAPITSYSTDPYREPIDEK